jgi:pimeloyl-ACP methyl ester carboxylesterase
VARVRRRRRRSGPRVWPLISLPFAAVALYAVVCVAAFFVMSRPERHFNPQNNPGRYGAAYREVRFTARGGDVRLAGWLLPATGSDRALILVHGKDGSRSDELNGLFPELAAALERGGFNVLMLDLRGHGQSDAGRFSFGPDEGRDVEGGADWLKAQGFRPGSIGVLGISLGAAAGIYATAADPDIGALVEDSSYAAVFPIIQRNWSDASHLPDFFLPGTLLAGRWIEHYDIRTISPADQIGRIAPRPVLIVHGKVDGLIPTRDAQDLQAADPAAEVWIVPQAGHAGAYAAGRDAYVSRVADFFSKWLGAASEGPSAVLRSTAPPFRRQ